MTPPVTPRLNYRRKQLATTDGHDSPTRSAMGWSGAARCRGADIETFFPPPGDQAAVRRALTICDLCPVLIPCRRYALSHRERHGIWGGLTEEIRDTLIRLGPPPLRVPSGRAAPAEVPLRCRVSGKGAGEEEE
ncbi:WhiB family transcriptional regulator [Streptomyces sp. NBC_01373]|uniref:WhiB family transcriptional regulator n=1 Tax=unclassified Streptomyces TaxID=2593676 RepID=UPI002255D302|nr:WhiB family transcriptional regulator [Streptomyces sp. NBC_01373]MCX4702763.1 WhiB family transcriptional regulator [Streptomyces sp. NBC_01373]